MQAQPVIYRIIHQQSNSIALLSFSYEGKRVQVKSFKFVQGSILDLDKYRLYKRHYTKAVQDKPFDPLFDK